MERLPQEQPEPSIIVLMETDSSGIAKQKSSSGVCDPFAHLQAGLFEITSICN
jgi:hypothetical protein